MSCVTASARGGEPSGTRVVSRQRMVLSSQLVQMLLLPPSASRLTAIADTAHGPHSSVAFSDRSFLSQSNSLRERVVCERAHAGRSARRRLHAGRHVEGPTPQRTPVPSA